MRGFTDYNMICWMMIGDPLLLDPILSCGFVEPGKIYSIFVCHAVPLRMIVPNTRINVYRTVGYL